MVATDVALRMTESPGALAVLSGTLLCEKRWKDMADRRGPLPVLQTHGHFDSILPYQCAEWLKEMFEQAGFPVDFRAFPGMHQIPITALEGLVDQIGRIGS
jgi:predicted esterase